MLILASASSARAALLRSAGIRFRVEPSGARELKGRGLTLRQAVLANARLKAAPVARRHPEDWILAADTMIEFRGRLYGKPRDRKAALALLGAMAGRTHRLATGVVLRLGGRRKELVALSRVTLRDVGPDRIRRAFDRNDPTRLAGGYAVRRKGDPLVARIVGSFTNVVGLPMEVVAPLLKRL